MNYVDEKKVTNLGTKSFDAVKSACQDYLWRCCKLFPAFSTEICGIIGQAMLCDWLQHMHISMNGPLYRTTVSRYQTGKTNLDFTEARDSEWSSAPRSRQITTPAPHCSVFYRPDVLPAAQPTASKHCDSLENSGNLILEDLSELWHARLWSAVGGCWRSTVGENIEQSASHTVPATSTTIYSITEL